MIELTEEQKELTNKILHWYRNFDSSKPYFYYSGAAGTGKTTVFKYVIDRLGLNRDEYVAVAYVGKAVLVLLKQGLPASTIHSLIYMPRTNVNYDVELDEWGNPHKVKKTSHEFVLRKYLSKKIKLIFIDEISMVNDKMLDDLYSFGRPIVMAGDQNQLPPVIGTSTLMDNPDYVLHQIMRQAENNPIIYLSQCVLAGIPVNYQKYGNSEVVKEYPINETILDDFDQILCVKNKTRDELNDRIRKEILGYEDRVPQIGDRMVCRHNNRRNALVDSGVEIFLSNGLVGEITDINYCSLHRDLLYVNFKPDFTDKEFKKLTLDYSYTKADWKDRKGDSGWSFSTKKDLDYFEFAYAITAHLSQGSEYNKVLFMEEKFSDINMQRRIVYTALTRAREKIVWVKRNDKDEKKFFFYNGRKYEV